MKRYINLFLALVVAVIFAGCSKENPFGGSDTDVASGSILKSALSVELGNEEGYPALFRNTRAATPTADDFTVDFIKDGEDTPEKTYLFSEMPEVVTLPVGAWKAVAHYGDNKSAAWEEPYFKGETSFIVVADKITEDADPIVAKLSNVRVSISFSASLKANMSADSKVTVKVGESGTIDFTAADAERSAYFAYVENSCSLTATFSGDVEGYPVVESKVYDTVQPGSHYSITFRMHDAGEDEVGTVTPGITVDASVTIEDMNITLDPEEDEILEDDLRPVEGEPTTPVDPVDPNDPVKPGNVPTIEPMKAPDGQKAIVFDEWNVVEVGTTYAAFKITSSAPDGFESVKVEIVSEKLNPDELGQIGLTNKFDLADPVDQEYWEQLNGLGFPTDIKGKKESEFDITSFMPLIVALGTPSEHKFVVTVTDANGTITKTLMLRFE